MFPFTFFKFYPFLFFRVCRVCEKEGVKLVVDNISYDFVKGATVDYVEELIRCAFVVSKPLSVLLTRSLFASMRDLFYFSRPNLVQ